MRIIGPAPIIGKVSTAAIDDDAITEAKVANDAIGITELKAGTDGNVISFDSSGNPVFIATGNDSQVLTSAGAGAQPAFEDAGGGGAWNLIGTSEASNSASLTITGIDSTYDVYCITMSQLVPATDGATPYLRVGAGSIDSGSSDYSWSVGGTTHSDTTHFLDGNEDNEDSEMELTATTDMGGVGSAAGEGFNATLWMNRPTDGTTRVGIGGTAAYFTTNSNCVGHHITGARRAVISLDRVSYLFSSGNVSTGRLSVFGVSHAT